ncbi:hypothetical protein CGLO_11649 [Colletotrichum gloeosporioides Cg-14]|uniref:Cytochrome P450 n=1 Tax=Colletotrichum gloeosporioides (strain Cg-14) TaxID=1237896 RepID=T0K7U5_COLGC|nr:hypothetical protein CGLO_11649 [Colletotrichum gloeosporioides Cg-14]
MPSIDNFKETLAIYWPFVVVFLLCISLIQGRYSSNLHRIPGPFLSSVSIIPRIRSIYRGNSHEDELELHKKYGNFVRVGPRTVSISDPAHIEKIYGISSNFFKAGFYEPIRFHDEEGLVPDPLVLADKATHTRMKRNAANAYALQALVQLEPLVDRTIDNLLKHLDICYASTGAICNLGEYMHFFAMDTIFNITFGRDLDFINSGDPKGFCRQLQNGLGYLVCIGQIPWAHRFLLGNRVVAGLLNRLTDEESVFDKVMSLATSYRTIAEKEALIGDDEATSCTFLSRLLRNQTRNPSLITDREINTHIFGNITAGGDTTSTALRAVLRDLIRHPAVTHRLLVELRNAGLDKTETQVPYSVASKLPYLSAIIRESMRLHPSVGMMLARGVPPEGAVFRDGDRNEYHIGPGVEVGINPWVVHRNPQVFPNPEVYSPERWLEAAPEQLAQMKRAWMPFGAGRHTCSGQHISMLEITKLVPTIVLRYGITWSSPIEDVSVFNRFFTIQKGLHVKLEKKGQ